MTNEPIKLLLDEHIWEGLTEALTQRGYDVVHISHTGQRGIDDEPLLALATTQGRAILTYPPAILCRWSGFGTKPVGGM
jgi:predicted nuclease of predicted toxin-antitoxin system